MPNQGQIRECCNQLDVYSYMDTWGDDSDTSFNLLYLSVYPKQMFALYK